MKKRLIHTSSSMLLLSFFRIHHNYFFRKGFQNVEAVLIYQFNYNSFKSTLSKWYLLTWVQLLSNKLNFFVSCNIKLTRTSFLLCVSRFTFLWKSDCSPSWGQNIIFYFNICIKFTLSTIIQQRSRNDNVSLDVCYKTTFSWLKYVWEKKNNNRKNPLAW